ncbi:hypothetical protein PVK64_20105 [Aliivibrio sp. S4TY2]|uniref:hypothetical protein n=1 Tax=unclassified Aliivibrio TaxID=2645654 RepID=UPI00237954E9|nr:MULTISPECIES: hypothetical protein [unclassified Aliivibrio]MDD9158470.1 hypothetical protein [Aliivibrio sp. S4TY2]MDD9162465.1 hypothetical protein [Aliivibrio sp. S4TY1]MDD9166464.1 hypothetical protein [Aliivibrio sp. S4MY2]MDD9170467.1 hypothetical protein [Aliivibrio sp. S4MY4]MDD9187543.1 hypothetical protein [Aliivibrio sp. S4MY3]
MRKIFHTISTLVVVVALLNLINSLVNLEFHAVFNVVTTTYQAAFHKPLDIPLSLIGIALSNWQKDIFFIYVLFGFAFEAARRDEERVELSKGHFFNFNGDKSLLYKKAPKLVKVILDRIFWPRVAYQYFVKPGAAVKNKILIRELSNGNEMSRSIHTVHLYDRRLKLLKKLVQLFVYTALALAINGFLVAP